MVAFEINGTALEADGGKTVLEAARENNIEIPTLCSHKALPAYGACRLCVVEIVNDRGSQLVASCTFPVSDGLKIITDSEKVLRSRKMTIELLLSRCPDEEVLLDYAREYGLKRTRFKDKDDNCIFCGLCVRMCSKMGVKAIDFTGRGMDRELGTPYLETSDVCITCGACASVCPTTRFTHKKAERISGNKPIYIPSEFNQGMNTRPAIYIPFPQAVPKIPVIDQQRCVYYQTGNCRTCENFCEPGAIKYDQEDEILELDVGAIVVATGYDLYDPASNPKFGYGTNENVLTGLEFERICSASGPTEGRIEINGKVPEKVVFIQCVGSREREEDGNHHCSRVCCMYTAKHAHLVLDRLPGADVKVLYTDVRSFGKGFEEFVNRVKDEGVDYIRRELDDPLEVARREEDDVLLVKSGDTAPLEADLVVLATAVIPRKDSKEGIGKVLKLSQSADGFLLEAHPKLRPVDTITPGIYLAGCAQGPKDIPDTVAQSSGAAARALIPLSKGKVKLEPIISSVIDKNCDGCAYCIEPCPYNALTLIEYMRNGEIKKTVQTADAVCQGCGVCQATCPKEGIVVRGFKLGQLKAMVDAVLEVY